MITAIRTAALLVEIKSVTIREEKASIKKNKNTFRWDKNLKLLKKKSSQRRLQELDLLQ
jgi:hypothetical protein